jgi:hypothetical protein
MAARSEVRGNWAVRDEQALRVPQGFDVWQALFPLARTLFASVVDVGISRHR